MTAKKSENVNEVLERFRRTKRPGETLLEFIEREDRTSHQNPTVAVARLVAAMKCEKIDPKIIENFVFTVTDDEGEELLADWERFNRTGMSK